MASRFNSDSPEIPRYAEDFAAWSFYQSMLLRSGQLHLLDRAWIAEELDSLGHQEFDRLESEIRIILAAKHLKRNPGLAPCCDEVLIDVYDDARRDASGKTDMPLKTFPLECPYACDEVMSREVVWPDDAAA